VILGLVRTEDTKKQYAKEKERNFIINRKESFQSEPLDSLKSEDSFHPMD